MENNLRNMNKSVKWLNKKLKEKNIKLEDILLGTLDINDELHFYYEKNKREVKYC